VTGMRTKLDTWLSDARRRVQATPLGPIAEQIGRVEKIADGIAEISGLPNVRLGELVRFESGHAGFAAMLDRDVLGCVFLDDPAAIEAGDIVHGTGEVARVPVGPKLLGRVVDPLGHATLQHREQQLRQEEITTEIIELAAGAEASRTPFA
jgi:F-type H+/Na+-transporting ATPase subunit alpha